MVLNAESNPAQKKHMPKDNFGLGGWMISGDSLFYVSLCLSHFCQILRCWNCKQPVLNESMLWWWSCQVPEKVTWQRLNVHWPTPLSQHLLQYFQDHEGSPGYSKGWTHTGVEPLRYSWWIISSHFHGTMEGTSPSRKSSRLPGMANVDPTCWQDRRKKNIWHWNLVKHSFLF